MPAIDALSFADHSWPILRRLMGVHTHVYRLTGGVIGHRFPGGPPMLLLDHVGAKSAAKRTTPLLYVDDPPNVVIVASKGGYPRNPAWYHNLRAHPETTVQIGSERRRVRARVATAAERKRLWPMAVEAYSGYEGYQERTDREIPLVILEPLEQLGLRQRERRLMAYDEDLAERIRRLIGDDPALAEKKMFGGLAFLINGNMSVAASGQGGIMIRCAPQDTDVLLAEPGAEHLIMRGRAMDGWLRVGSDAVAGDPQLESWVNRGVGYARSLPPK